MSNYLSFSHWSDPLCIWAFLAEDKLEQLLAEFGDRLQVEYRVVPVFGSLPHRFTHGPWARDGIEGRARATAKIAAEHGHPEVSGDCFRRDCPSSSWAPGCAIKAVCALERQGRVAVGSTRRYQTALRRAFFVDSINVAHRRVQLEQAEALKLPREPIAQQLDDGSALAALWEDNQLREQLKLQGSPTYVFDAGRAMLYGDFNFGVLHATVEQLLRGIGADGSAC